MRVAAFDCGTNSLRLLVADVDPVAGTLVDVDRRMEVVRLGQGVDATGRIAPEALARTLAVAAQYADLCAALGVERRRFVATSASRDASNRNDFVAGVQAIVGVEPEVVAGEEEARLSFLGATRGLGADGDVLVVDIGGGSTEVVLGDPATGVTAARSVDVGCVRLTERYALADPPTAAQVAALVADVDRALDDVAAVVPLERARTVVGLAGSVTTVTAHALRLPAYDSARIHGARLRLPRLVAACDELVALTRVQRAALPFMHPGRVDVIGAGALVWREVLLRVSAVAPVADAMTSEHDILDGIAWSLAERG